MSASKAPTVINSELKKVKPPTAYSCCMADCANMKVYFKLFNDCLSSKDDEHVERLTHLIVLASRLHNAALEGGLLPLVKQLSSGGGTMAQEMSEMVRKRREFCSFPLFGRGCTCITICFSHVYCPLCIKIAGS
jgi:hypothetical protein